MKTGRTLALVAMLAVQPICMFGASWVSVHNPVGEAVYRPHLLRGLLHMAVIVCALLIGWFVHLLQRKHKMIAPDDAGSHLG